MTNFHPGKKKGGREEAKPLLLETPFLSGPKQSGRQSLDSIMGVAGRRGSNGGRRSSSASQTGSNALQ